MKTSLLLLSLLLSGCISDGWADPQPELLEDESGEPAKEKLPDTVFAPF